MPVSFRGEEAEARPRRAAAAPADDASPADEKLWQLLRTLRLEIAREQGVPPYIIFHDTTLLAMARSQPRDLATMAVIPGVGASKLKRYGDRFLAAIRDGATAA